MALRELILPWDAQPQEVAGVNWSHPISGGLSVALTASHGLKNIAGQPSEASLQNGASFAATAAGISYRFNGSSDGLAIDASQGGQQYTIFSIAQTTTTVGTRNIASIGAASSYAAQLRQDGSQWSLYQATSTDFLAGEASAVTAGVLHVVAGTWDGATIRLYRAGILRAQAAVPSIRSVSSLRVGHDNFGAKQAWSGDIPLLLYWPNRALSAQEIAELSGNPWQLFEPLRIWVPVSAGGGATNLTVAEASHGHTADSLTLSIGVSLAINDATHGHAADALTLSTAATLAVADATHAHAADQVTLTLAGSESLTIADSTHAHIADAPVLSVDSLLAVDDALHAHSADNVVLGVTGVADLIIADATHAHSVDGLVLTTDSLLAIQDALHAHAADELTLNSAPTLLIAEALHAHTSDGLALTVDAWLVVADALHGHTADAVVLTVAGGELDAAPGYTITGRRRAFKIRGRARRFEVDQ